MVEKALSKGWITPNEAELLAPQRMLEILQRKSPRGWVAAARMLDTMKRTTLVSLDTAIRVEQHELGKAIVADVEGGMVSSGEAMPDDSD